MQQYTSHSCVLHTDTSQAVCNHIPLCQWSLSARGKLQGSPVCSCSERHMDGRSASGMLTASGRNLLIILPIQRAVRPGLDLQGRGQQFWAQARWPSVIPTCIYSESWKSSAISPGLQENKYSAACTASVPMFRRRVFRGKGGGMEGSYERKYQAQCRHISMRAHIPTYTAHFIAVSLFVWGTIRLLRLWHRTQTTTKCFMSHLTGFFRYEVSDPTQAVQHPCSRRVINPMHGGKRVISFVKMPETSNLQLF